MIDVTIEPVRRVTLVDSAVDRIRDVIENRGLKPGDRLPGEHDLAERLDVSRSVVREAISRLQTVGLLTAVRGRGGGTFVGNQDTVLGYASVVRSAMSICEKDARQFAEYRAALEIYSARRACETASAEDIAELDDLCDCIGSSKRQGDVATDADFCFHRKLAEIARNEVIVHTLQLSREFIKSTIRNTGPKDPHRSQMQHLAVVDAIRRRDPDGAEQAMRLHMESVIEDMIPDSPE